MAAISARVAAPSRPVSLTRRRVIRTLAALAIASGALAAQLFILGLAHRPEPYLAVAREVAAGQTLTSEDLRRADYVLPGETRALAVPLAQASSVIGQPVAQRLPPGSLLTYDRLVTTPLPTDGQVAIAIGLRPELTPPLNVGSRVDVISLARPSAAGATTASVAEDRPVLVTGAIVQAVSYAAPSLAAAPLSGPAPSPARAGARVPSGVVLLVAPGEAASVLAAAAGSGVALALRFDGPAGAGPAPEGRR